MCKFVIVLKCFLAKLQANKNKDDIFHKSKALIRQDTRILTFLRTYMRSGNNNRVIIPNCYKNHRAKFEMDRIILMS